MSPLRVSHYSPVTPSPLVRSNRVESIPVTRIQVSGSEHLDERKILVAAKQLGVKGLSGCRCWDVYHIQGHLNSEDFARICDEILVDPVTDEVVVGPPVYTGQVVEVAPLPGVTDVTARELERAAEVLGLAPLQVATARRYELNGDLSDTDIGVLTKRLLANSTIERSSTSQLEPVFSPPVERRLRIESVRLRGLSDEELIKLSQQCLLSLDLNEMKTIQAYFVSCGRDPTDAELETLAQTWSEHCAHKTFKARIELTHTHADGRVEVSHHDSLLDALKEATEELEVPWLRSVFVDNAGIIAFDGQFDLAVKVETHNHPSALEPFGGANTGIGGVVRDIMGVSARPIACTNVLCFGPSDFDDGRLPEGLLHPRRIRDGVVAGIGDYGNKLGLPTVNGAVIYDQGYIGNPLVFCGALGLMPSDSHRTTPRPGDRIIVIGGRTGRDGIHGATFSSAGLDVDATDQASSAVQIGDPITQKGCMEVLELARDLGLYNAITDCGAGGFSSAVGEMGAELGAEVDLASVPLKYPGLQPWEIWVSEAQERMVLAVPEGRLAQLRKLCDDWDVELSDVGLFTDDKQLVVRYEDSRVIDLPMSLLHDGLPQSGLKAVHKDRAIRHSDQPAKPLDASFSTVASPVVDPADLLLELLAHPNVCSREPIIRTYDHEVRGGTVIRPLVGPAADGPSDAAVIKPLGTWHHDMAIAIAAGINPRLTSIDPWLMALHTVDEAMRNLVASGADPDRVALLDNFSWGNPTRPNQLGSLVRAVQGCVEAARRYQSPFISGKDSLYNEFEGTAVPGTLLITAVGVVPDLHKTVTSALTDCGSDIWLVGSGSGSLGGSVVEGLLDIDDHRAPPAVSSPLTRYRAVHELIAASRVKAAHDISDGGIAVALAEMAIGGRLGLRVTVPYDLADPEETSDSTAAAQQSDSFALIATLTNEAPTTMKIAQKKGDSFALIAALTNEAPGRILLETSPVERRAVAEKLGHLGRRIGSVTDTGNIEIRVAVSPAETSVFPSSTTRVGTEGEDAQSTTAETSVFPSSTTRQPQKLTDCMVVSVSDARRAFKCEAVEKSL